MEKLTEILNLIPAHVASLFSTHQRAYLLYHNLHHTKEVVQHCTELADYYLLTGKDRFILLASAWFHDTGQLFSEPKGHEEVSISIMRDFFKTNPIENEALASIANCIRSTEISTLPGNLLEQIICDADTYHFGTDEFWITDELVKKESMLRQGIAIKDWGAKTLSFLENHRFFTSYCQQRLNPGKQININKLKERMSANSGE
jgi:predicted metal-dependent HD superfamily phosphohydrolase